MPMNNAISWIPGLEITGQPLYLSIIKSLTSDIEAGRLSHGTRLPTQRDLADVLGVALGTVTHAYSEAEKRGLIHSEGRRGTFVGDGSGKRTLLSELLETGTQVIDLSKNHPTYAEDPDLPAALRKLARRPESQWLLHYPPTAGLPRHREAGARWLNQLGLETNGARVILTAGAQHALTVVLATVTDFGDVIATEEYSYPGIKDIADFLGLQVMGVPMDNHGLVPDGLRAVCRQRRVRALYFNPTLQNPTNIIFTEERRRAIAQLAEEFDFIMVEDEILRPLVSNPLPFASSFAPSRSCTIVSSSKTIAAGLRVAYLSAPTALVSRLTDTMRTTVLSLPAVTSEILTVWLEDGTADEIIVRRRAELDRRLKLARNILEEYDMQAPPESSHIWLRLPQRWTTTQFTIEAHKRGVAVAPAEVFHFGRQSPVNAVRISLGTAPNRETLKKGLEIIAATLKSSPFREPTAI